MPRPPIQHHKQIVELGPDLKTALDDGSIRDLVVLHEQGQAAKGFLSTNAGAIAVVLGGLSVLMAFPPTQQAITAFIAFWIGQVNKLAVDILNRIVPTPEEVAGVVVEGVEKVAETARDAWERINREIEQRREDGEIPPAPPFIPPFFPP